MIKSTNARRGFTIVELLIVIVVIAILATITIVAYNGVSQSARASALQASVSQGATKLETYKVANNDTYPPDLATVGLTAPSGTTYNYNVSGSTYCLSATSSGTSYHVTNSNNTPTAGACSGVMANGTTCPAGFIVVPGNSTFGTSDFCTMKYEAKQDSSTVPISQASGVPWINISQTNAIAYSANVAGCSGCHLITEAEWMTIAANIISVASNWSGGSVGSGYIYNGHANSNPASGLAADTNDANGMYGITGGTGNSPSYNNRRTLTLTNGEVIWDFAGNVWEWTNAAINGGQQPGFSGEYSYSWRQWNNSSLLMNGLPTLSQPGAISGTVAGYSSAQGIGEIFSNYGESGQRSFIRGGTWDSSNNPGVLTLNLSASPNGTYGDIGFRVSR